MQDPSKAIRTGAKTKVDAACVAASYAATCTMIIGPKHGRALPYVEDQGSLVFPRHNKTDDGTETVHTYVCWHNDPNDAQQLCGVVLAALTNRASPITVSGHTLVCSELDAIQNVIQSEGPNGPYYGVPLRIRYKTHE